MGADPPLSGPTVSHADPAAEHARASDLLRMLAERGSSGRVTLGEMMEAFGERAFGLLMIVFSLPNLVPVPGIGALFGIPLLLLALQLALGRPKPLLPRGIEAKSIDRASLRRMVDAVEPRLRRVESILRPRYTMLFSPVMDRVIGAFVALCSLSIIIPFPGTNFPPAVAVILISLAVAEEDGVYLALGFVIGAAGLVYTGTVVGGLAYAGLIALPRLLGF